LLEFEGETGVNEGEEIGFVVGGITGEVGIAVGGEIGLLVGATGEVGIAVGGEIGLLVGVVGDAGTVLHACGPDALGSPIVIPEIKV